MVVEALRRTGSATGGEIVTDRELEDLEEDLRNARRELYVKERAPLEHRVADAEAYERSLERARERVRELEAEWDQATAGIEEETDE